MDYFGRYLITYSDWHLDEFQSFWVNGLLWKNAFLAGPPGRKRSFNPSGSMDYFGSARGRGGWRQKAHLVSILLGQWITLEE